MKEGLVGLCCAPGRRNVVSTKQRSIPRVPGLFDSHAHLDDPRFEGDLELVLQRAREVGVEHILTVGAEPDRLEAPVRIAQEYPGVWAGVGLHAHEARYYDRAVEARIRELLAEPRVVAVGEIGLDYHYMHSPRDVQLAVFRAQLELACELDKPVVVHVREAHEDALAILTEFRGRLTGVIHCFSGDVRQAEAYLDLGLHLGFGGVVTFKRADLTRQVAALVPEERLLVETDAPYLAPVPFRGKRCEPAHVTLTALRLAELRSTVPTELARTTTANAMRLFRLAGQDPGTVAYELGRNLYLNVTNRCDLNCRFCLKHDGYQFAGYDLALRRRVVPADVAEAVADKDLSAYEEVVYCGLGEPTLELETLLESARMLRQRGAKRIRLDTDGLANLRHGRDVTPELAQVLDAVSVSLNAQDPETYARLCPSRWGPAAHGEILRFAQQVARRGLAVRLTAVALPEVDAEACERLARDLGVPFLLRP